MSVWVVWRVGRVLLHSYRFVFSSITLSLFLVYKYLIIEDTIFILNISAESLTIILGGFIAFFLFRLGQEENNMLNKLINKLKGISIINLLFN